MLLLKISYWIAFASAAICIAASAVNSQLALIVPAITAFVGGSVIAGLDRIVGLLERTHGHVDATVEEEPADQFTPGALADLLKERQRR